MEYSDTNISQKKTNANQPADIILIMDSNRRFVKPELLKKSIEAFKHYCPTLSAMKNKIEGIKTEGTIPKLLLLHVGTNDLEKMGAF